MRILAVAKALLHIQSCVGLEAVAPCLLQHQTRRSSNTASSDSILSKTNVEPSFFSGFADGESTFDADGALEVEAKGSEADAAVTDVLPTIRPPNWFTETPSAGAKEAWQTYDEVSEDASWRARAPEWRVLDFGRIKQGWNPVASRMQSNSGRLPGKDSSWFDTSVSQPDYFGRPRAPSASSAKFYLEWSQTTRTANLNCGPPGCVANASLKAFDTEMENRMCMLSLMVHATDFDDQYDVERIEWIVINGKEALRDFSPRAPKGCEINDNISSAFDSDLEVGLNDTDPSLISVSRKRRRNVTSARPLYPCLRDMPLEGLVGKDGIVNISGKISPAVDECPVDGHHLSGVVTVTCFTRPTTTPLPSTTTTTETKAVKTVREEFKRKDSAHFGCEVPGCKAATLLSVDSFNLTSRKCFLTVRINQTDFDELDGTKERIESLKVNQKVKASDLKPGKNPCHEAMENRSSRKNEEAVVLHEDVTDDIKDGVMMVELKITDMVDECAVGQNLLDGQAEVSCEG